MSSHTHPQKVHVAFLTISISQSTRLLVARTGRHEERSSQLPAAVTPSSPSRLESSFLDLGPVRYLLFGPDAVADRLLSFRYRVQVTIHVHSSEAVTTEPEAGRSSSSTSTSHPLDRCMPVPSVYCPIKRQVGGPYGMKIIPFGVLPSTHLKVSSPHNDRTRTVLPFGTPISFISSGCITIVLTVAL